MTDGTAGVAEEMELFFAAALLEEEEEEVDGAGGMMTLPPMLDWRIFLA